eukprot:9662434-Lingulodinium_polyedra.AAC.1
MGWSDASFAHVKDKDEDDVPLASQGGYLLGFVAASETGQAQASLSICHWLSHKLPRKARSTLAAESM